MITSGKFNREQEFASVAKFILSCTSQVSLPPTSLKTAPSSVPVTANTSKVSEEKVDKRPVL